MGDACGEGLLTVFPSSNCMGALANQIICALECVGAFIILVRLMREVHRVPPTLQMVILCYSLLLVSMTVVCGIGASGSWDVNLMYVFWFLGHFALSFGIAFRTNAFVQLMAIASVGRVDFNFRAYMGAVFGFTICVNLGIFYFWGFAGFLMHTPEDIEAVHRLGFVVFGAWSILAVSALVFFSRFVIKLLESVAVKPSPEQTARLLTLKRVTISGALSIGTGGVVFFVAGVVPGALRNEVMHFYVLGLIGGMFNLIRFMRQCAEVNLSKRSAASGSMVSSPSWQSSRGSAKTGTDTNTTDAEAPPKEGRASNPASQGNSQGHSQEPGNAQSQSEAVSSIEPEP